MKLRHTIYNSIGLGVAGLAAVLFVMAMVLSMSGRNYHAQAHPVQFLLGIGSQLLLITCLGGGGLANLVSNQLKPKPTTMMIVAYCLTCVLIPLGIWGIIELRMAGDRSSQRDRVKPSAAGRCESSRHDSSFAPWAAAMSWFLPVGGFIAVILAGSTHQRPLIDLTLVIVTFGMLVSLACGIYALFCVREHGKKGILLPALIGTVISGFFVLFVLIALIASLVVGVSDMRQLHRGTPAQTNAAPVLQ